MNVAIHQIVTADRRREEAQAELAHQAAHDSLTGLPNRAQSLELLTGTLNRAQRSGAMIGLLFVDLDGFKAVNDNLGHRAGDAVLHEVGERLRGVVRQNDLVGRLGGDEFVVICETVDAESAQTVAGRITDAIRAPYPGVPASLPVSASVGVVLTLPAGHHVPTSDELLTRADAAMYRSKNGGRDRVTIELV